MSDPTDSFTKTGAERLARTIRDFWTGRGHVVRVTTFPIEGQENMHGVRSNLVNGRPRATVVDLEAFNASRAGAYVPGAVGVYRL